MAGLADMCFGGVLTQGAAWTESSIDKLVIRVLSEPLTNCGAGGSAEFVIVAKDIKGVRKSLGGDVFKASWIRVDSTESAVSARVCYYHPESIFMSQPSAVW